MLRPYGILPLLATGCALGNASQMTSAAVEPGTLDILGAISRAQANAKYVTDLSEFKKKSVAGWIDEAKAGLIEQALNFNGQNFAGLKTKMKVSSNLKSIIDSFNNQYSSVGTILRAYGVPKDLQVSAGDVDDYLRLSTAGIKFAETGQFPYKGDMDGQLYLRALNAGLAFSAAAKGTKHQELAATATVGYIFAIHGLLQMEANSIAGLALSDETSKVDSEAASRILERDHLSLLSCGSKSPIYDNSCKSSGGKGTAKAKAVSDGKKPVEAVAESGGGTVIAKSEAALLQADDADQLIANSDTIESEVATSNKPTECAKGKANTKINAKKQAAKAQAS